MRRSKTKNQKKKKSKQGRRDETRRDERWCQPRNGAGAKRGDQRGGAESGAAPETRVPADARSSRPAAPVAMHPLRRGDEEVPLTLMLLPAGREDLRLDVVGARLEKFEALRDGKFEMKDMVPCSGLEPLQSASMVASWPRRCAALRAFVSSIETPSSTKPRKNREMCSVSISQRAKVSLVGEHEKSKIDVMFWKNFRVILPKRGPHTLAPYYEGGSNRMLGCPSDPGDRRKHQVELVGTYRGNLGRGIACRSSQRRERERERERACPTTRSSRSLARAMR